MNLKDLNQNTALHFACKSNNVECVMLLLKRNVDTGVRNIENKMAFEMTNNTEIISLFQNIE